jgi:hypothetical protein
MYYDVTMRHVRAIIVAVEKADRNCCLYVLCYYHILSYLMYLWLCSNLILEFMYLYCYVLLYVYTSILCLCIYFIFIYSLYVYVSSSYQLVLFAYPD